MRYFTKQWYTDTIIADMCFQLRKTEKAGTFSESFFEKLYAIEKRAYIKFCKRSAKAARTKFDAVAASEGFDSNYLENLDFVRSNLPDDILSDVKDIRVLALGSATNDMAMRITRFCGQKNRACEAVERKYNESSEETDEKLGGVLTHSLLSIIGASLVSTETKDDDVIISFSDPEGKNIVLSLCSAELLEKDPGIDGSTILKTELLCISDGRYEFSVLSISSDNSLCTMTYTAKDISIE